MNVTIGFSVGGKPLVRPDGQPAQLQCTHEELRMVSSRVQESRVDIPAGYSTEDCLLAVHLLQQWIADHRHGPDRTRHLWEPHDRLVDILDTMDLDRVNTLASILTDIDARAISRTVDMYSVNRPR